jgi:hypothetical protein
MSRLWRDALSLGYRLVVSGLPRRLLRRLLAMTCRAHASLRAHSAKPD